MIGLAIFTGREHKLDLTFTEEMAAPTRAQGRHARSLDGGLSDLLPGTVQSGRTLPLPPNGRKLEK